jgi:hypothetical protein
MRISPAQINATARTNEGLWKSQSLTYSKLTFSFWRRLWQIASTSTSYLSNTTSGCEIGPTNDSIHKHLLKRWKHIFEVIIYLFTMSSKPGLMMSISDFPVDSGPSGRRRFIGVLLLGVLQSLSWMPSATSTELSI